MKANKIINNLTSSNKRQESQWAGLLGIRVCEKEKARRLCRRYRVGKTVGKTVTGSDTATQKLL